MALTYQRNTGAQTIMTTMKREEKKSVTKIDCNRLKGRLHSSHALLISISLSAKMENLVDVIKYLADNAFNQIGLYCVL